MFGWSHRRLITKTDEKIHMRFTNWSCPSLHHQIPKRFQGKPWCFSASCNRSTDPQEASSCHMDFNSWSMSAATSVCCCRQVVRTSPTRSKHSLHHQKFQNGNLRKERIICHSFCSVSMNYKTFHFDECDPILFEHVTISEILFFSEITVTFNFLKKTDKTDFSKPRGSSFSRQSSLTWITSFPCCGSKLGISLGLHRPPKTDQWIARGRLPRDRFFLATKNTPPKTNMTMGNPPFEDVFPIENGDFQLVMLVFRGVDVNWFRVERIGEKTV